MNGASKILTVSYGTFSCTLEGFDDPFNTMKAIAEYFRDLAAEDRYFGAEPPQPDAAMLHKIAEREIQRRVEAKVQENGVILRAEDHGALSAPVAEKRAAPVASGTGDGPQPVVQIPARTTAAPARPAPTLAQTADDSPAPAGAAAEAGAESVAEKLSRLRKAAAESQSTAATATVLTAAAPLVAPQDDFTEDQHADAPEVPAFNAEDEGSDLPSETMAFDDNLPEDFGATAEEIVAGDLPPEEQISETDRFDDAGEADDLADLMALDTAPRDMQPQAGPAGPESDTGLADDMSDLTTRAVAEDAPLDDDTLLAGLAADTSTPDTLLAATDAEPAEDAMSDDALLASLGALIDPEDDADTQEPVVQNPAPMALEPAVQDVAEDDAAAQDETAANETLTEPVLDAAPQDEPAEPQSEPAAAEAEALDAQEPAQDDAPATTDATPVTPVRPVRPVRTLRPTAVERPSVPAALVAELAADPATDTGPRAPVTMDRLQRARARVIKIRRNENPAAAQQTTPAPTSLSQEAEAALAAELAALEQDSTASAATEPAPARPTQKSDPAAELRLDQPTEEVAVSRLMAEASTKMDVPDAKRRQSAIAHLKAAVAATIAERRATGSTLAGNGSERMGAYRDDLAKVVRPSHGPASGERPAPLVLVSEQRIDRPGESSRPSAANAPAAATVQPIRPRRPMSSAALAVEPDLDDAFDLEDDGDNIFETDTGFPEFAERLGATDLPALLEAAAAYIACVEGRDSFTRPQLMRHVGAATEGVSREDGLRSFGTLLRDGVIERSRRGQFAISASSPFLAEARKIAG